MTAIRRAVAWGTALAFGALSALTSCTQGPTPNAEQTAGMAVVSTEIDVCGAGPAVSVLPPPEDRDSMYCQAEQLVWEYDSADGILVVVHSRVMLNCDAQLEVDVSVAGEGDTVVIQETVTPGYADCICPFDAAVAVSNAPAGPLVVSLNGENYTLALDRDVAGACALDTSRSSFCTTIVDTGGVGPTQGGAHE